MRDNKKISLESIVVEGVDPKDYPDFCDAFMTYAEWEDGTPLTEEELEKVADRGEYSSAVYDAACESFQ